MKYFFSKIFQTFAEVIGRKLNYDVHAFKCELQINLELVAKNGIIRKLEREAMENKMKMETMQVENKELKQKRSKESEQTRFDALSWKEKFENSEKQLARAESESRKISSGMHIVNCIA